MREVKRQKEAERKKEEEEEKNAAAKACSSTKADGDCKAGRAGQVGRAPSHQPKAKANSLHGRIHPWRASTQLQLWLAGLGWLAAAAAAG